MNISDPLQTDSFEIESAFIHPHEGKTEKVAIDANSIKQFEYSEGLMQKYVTVTLQIEDSTASLFESIFGMEEIELVVFDKFSDKKLEFTRESANGSLFIYEVHSKDVTDTVKTFVLELCREDALNNAVTRIGKKYTSVSAMELVKDVIEKELKSKKPIALENISDSYNKITFIPPNSKPYEILVWTRNKFISVDQKSTKTGGANCSAGYFFWEGYDTYNFQSFDSLAQQKQKAAAYSTGDGSGGMDEAFRLQGVQFPKTLNIMENFDQGFYSGEIDFFDITDCEVDTYRYNIKDNYAKWEKVAAQKDLPVLYKEALSDVSTRTMTVAYTKDLFLGSNEDNTNDKLMFLETVGQAVSRFGVFTSQVLTASCMSNLELRAGNIISIEIYGADGEVDKNQSGRYILFELRHIGTGANMRTNLTLVRDSFGV